MPHLRGYAPDVPLADLDPGARVDAAAGAAVVVGPVTALDDLARCLRSVLAHTGAAVPVLVVGGAEARGWLEELAAGTPERPLHLAAILRRRDRAPRPGRRRARARRRAVVAAGWLDGLRDAAARGPRRRDRDRAGQPRGRSPSVPRRNLPWGLLPGGHDARRRRARACASARCACARACPRARALRAAARAPRSTSPARSARATTSTRCWRASARAAWPHGLQHVLADDVLVAHRGGAGAGAARRAAAEPGRVGGPLLRARARAVGRVARACASPTVTVDGRCLTPGHERHAGPHARAHRRAGARRRGPRVRVVRARRASARRPAPRWTRVGASSGCPSARRSRASRGRDVVHRPWQVVSAADLRGARPRSASGSS